MLYFTLLHINPMMARCSFQANQIVKDEKNNPHLSQMLMSLPSSVIPNVDRYSSYLSSFFFFSRMYFFETGFTI
jgi:hypothetical protein